MVIKIMIVIHVGVNPAQMMHNSMLKIPVTVSYRPDESYYKVLARKYLDSM